MPTAPALALAQSSNVTLYGTFNTDFETVKAGAAFPSRNRVSSNSSLFGFRGSEGLGGGLNAWFQLENGVHIDGGGDALDAVIAAVATAHAAIDVEPDRDQRLEGIIYGAVTGRLGNHP